MAILINNVGWDRLQFFTETEPDVCKKIIQVNLVGMLNGTHCALEHMKKRGGSFVSLSSDTSRQGEPQEAVYDVMKAGINKFRKRSHRRMVGMAFAVMLFAPV